VTNRAFDEHLGAETLQAFLEGELSRGERARAEEHLASCARCAAELDGWQLLFEELGQLPPLAPAAGFQERVLAEVRAPRPLPWAARAAAPLGLGRTTRHPTSERLQDLVDGAVPHRQAARIRAHVDACPSCTESLAAWRALAARLGQVPRFVPGDGFAERVMAHVRVAETAPARAPEWRRALAAAWRIVPRTRRAWAAVCGVAVTPAATLGLLIWTVFTRPGITPGGLASFAWWKASGLASAAWGALSRTALVSEGLFGVYSFLGSLVHSPWTLAAVFLFFSLGTVSAVWVLYRNLVSTRRVEGGYAHASLS
jgi:anti-sigma factor RsiW